MKLDTDTLFYLARKNHQAGQVEAAILGYRELLLVEPDYPHASYLLGVALLGQAQYMEARLALEKHLTQRPDHIPGWVALADVHMALGQDSDALKAIQRALKLDFSSIEACKGMARLLVRKGDPEQILAYCRPLLKVHRSDKEVLSMLIGAMQSLELYLDAFLACASFCGHQADSEVIGWMEELFHRLKYPGADMLEALREFEDPRLLALYFRACIRAKDEAAALEAYRRLRSVDPENRVLSLEFLADAFQNVELYKAAEALHWELLERDPFNDKRLKRLIDNTLGRAKSDNPDQYDDALELANILMSRRPDDTDSFVAMANVYMGASRPELAMPYYDRIIALKPDHPLASPYLFTQNYDESRSAKKVYQAHRDWAQRFAQKHPETFLHGTVRTAPKDRLRIGYVSPDFGIHPVGYFSIEIIKAHSPETVDVFLYCNRDAEAGNDYLAQQFQEVVGPERWRWTRSWPTEKLLAKIEEDEIDVLVDMAGHTAYNRLDVFSRRGAPIQVSWLGYPNTTGLKTIDYRFSDEVVEPQGKVDLLSSEKIYRLPNGFHTYALSSELPPVADPPCLRSGFVTFGSYNNMNKLGSRSIDLWSQLLKRVPRSRLILKHKSLSVLNNREYLRSCFAMHGIQAHRIELRDATPGHVAHLATYGDIDVALDPLAYNGTTTSCDALVMGVPILTMPGETHASRVTSSLLTRLGLTGWIAESEEQFLQIGQYAAQNMDSLKNVRMGLREKFRNSPLGKGEVIARDMEAAYREMWTGYCRERA